MKYALDTKFMDNGHTIELLSIGLVCEDGREFYAQNRNANYAKASPWVQTHVLPGLAHRDCKPMGRKGSIGRMEPHCRKHNCPWAYHDQIGPAILSWMADPLPTFITYYGACDWVVFCRLFNARVQRPQGWPKYAHDLRSVLDMQGLAYITQPDNMPPHGLSDARWIMETWQRYSFMLTSQHGRP